LHPDKPYTLIGLFVFSILAILPLLSGFQILRRAEKTLVRFTERRTLSVWVVFFAVIGLRLLLLPALRIPIPGIHDEFSYLLMSDTFAHGRLTNPTHPMWVSFETMHVNWIPTYSSMYPPAQGLVMAIGQLLGHPWIGVLLSNAAMCALVVWMLQAWIPPRWAFLGGVIVALQLSFATYWMNSYWGGAIAAVGGALVFGALGRIRRTARLRDALLLGLGIAILANSRPYEGFLFCIPSAAYFLWWMIGKIKTRIELRARIRRVSLPLLGSMLLLGMFMAIYNWRLTGNPLLLPHVLNTETHVTAPLFLWQHAKPPLHFQNVQFEKMYNGWERTYYQTTWEDARRITLEKLDLLSGLFFWRAELLLLPFVFFLFRDRKMRLPLATLLLVTLGIFVVVWGEPHYAAPLVGVLAMLLVQTMRHMNTMEVKGRRLGAMMVRVIVVILLVQTAGRALNHECDQLEMYCRGNTQRADVANQLGNMPGKHLVIVRYGKVHNPHIDWVYNGAEIDSAKILWARDIDALQTEKLFAYFRDRQIWLVEPDEREREARQLKPFPRGAVPSLP
jgi:hypothetical protein